MLEVLLIVEATWIDFLEDFVGVWAIEDRRVHYGIVEEPKKVSDELIKYL